MNDLKQLRGARSSGRRSEQLTKGLQEQAFFLNVIEGRSCREIAQILSIDKTTASKYVREETNRRAEELESQRTEETVRALAFYAEVAGLAVEFAREGEPRGLEIAIRARERIDKIRGLDAAIKVDTSVQELLNALDDKRPE